MVFVFSDSEEHIVKKVKETIENESTLEYAEEIPEPVLSFQGLKIHVRNETVRLNENLVELSHQEFLVLHCLAKHPGWIFTKGQIYDVAYDEKIVEDMDNAVYCLIRNLRKKLEPDPHHPKYIQTVRGVGYKFVIPEE